MLSSPLRDWREWCAHRARRGTVPFPVATATRVPVAEPNNYRRLPVGVIDVADLVVRFGDVTAVDGVSFSVEAGEVVALLGPNGAGKTTTVETLEGYRRPTAGAVRVLGFDPRADHNDLVRRVGVMLQAG